MTGRIAGSPLIIALDVNAAADACALAERLDPARCRLKVGKELFTSAGPGVVESLQAMGFDIFLDLKFHDIPNTVAAALRSAAALGVWMVNVHASGGRRMLEAAAGALAPLRTPPLLIAVTVLTSMDESDFAELGYAGSLAEQASRLAALSADCGLDGVVCSAQEAPALRAQRGSDFCLVTPGIRTAGSERGDQRRVVTPSEARRLGSDYLVIGRSVTGAEDPPAAITGILDALDSDRG
jgi:orotidine-5'-phosphate decarboxylase